jgi:hypothetical protein
MVADDSPNDMLARLKTAADALDSAQKISRVTSREVARAEIDAAKAKKKIWANNSRKLK